MANSSSSGGLGCFSTILVLIGIWALLFGVTCNGTTMMIGAEKLPWKLVWHLVVMDTTMPWDINPQAGEFFVI